MDIEFSVPQVISTSFFFLRSIYSIHLDRILTDSDGYLHSYFLDNTQTANHEYVMFGLRELDPTEFTNYCSSNMRSPAPITDATVNFTSDFYMRAYTSGCYYLNEQSYWQTNDLVVSCFSCELKWIENSSCSGRSEHQSSSNGMLYQSFNYIRWWMDRSSCTNQLELCLCKS